MPKWAQDTWLSRANNEKGPEDLRYLTADALLSEEVQRRRLHAFLYD